MYNFSPVPNRYVAFWCFVYLYIYNFHAIQDVYFPWVFRTFIFNATQNFYLPCYLGLLFSVLFRTSIVFSISVLFQYFNFPCYSGLSLSFLFPCYFSTLIFRAIQDFHCLFYFRAISGLIFSLLFQDLRAGAMGQHAAAAALPTDVHRGATAGYDLTTLDAQALRPRRLRMAGQPYIYIYLRIITTFVLRTFKLL